MTFQKYGAWAMAEVVMAARSSGWATRWQPAWAMRGPPTPTNRACPSRRRRATINPAAWASPLASAAVMKMTG
jgi:hypothetical protein